MSSGFCTILTHIAFEMGSYQREKHWRQGIFIIVRFFQESLVDKSSAACGCVRWFSRGTSVSPHLLISSSRHE